MQLPRSSTTTFQARTLSPLKKVRSDGETRRNFCAEVCASHAFLRASADMIYEDVQKDDGGADADNGWSSSEFESYEEQSDSEAKPPTRSKVEP